MWHKRRFQFVRSEVFPTFEQTCGSGNTWCEDLFYSQIPHKAYALHTTNHISPCIALSGTIWDRWPSIHCGVQILLHAVRLSFTQVHLAHYNLTHDGFYFGKVLTNLAKFKMPDPRQAVQIDSDNYDWSKFTKTKSRPFARQSIDRFWHLPMLPWHWHIWQTLRCFITKGHDLYNHQFSTELMTPVDAPDSDWDQMVQIVGSQLQDWAKRHQCLLRQRNLGAAWDGWQPADEVQIHAPHLIDKYDDQEQQTS